MTAYCGAGARESGVASCRCVQAELGFIALAKAEVGGPFFQGGSAQEPDE